MADPLVSILMPCRNAAPWLEKALQSALSQSWPRTEVIVIDDGSTDGSGEIAGRFASARCQVVRQENRGASAARNRAFGFAQGDYIQYLDADDFLASDKLAQHFQVLDHDEKDVLSFASALHLPDDPRRGAGPVFHRAHGPLEGVDPTDFLIDLWTRIQMVQTAQWLVPRDLIEAAGPWDEKLSLDDDGEFFSRVILKACRIVPVPTALCFYRKFCAGSNLSATGGRRSGMRAAQMKGDHLLAATNDPRARQAVARIVTDEIVECCPAEPELGREGIRFLAGHGLKMTSPPHGSPVFGWLASLLGWRTARRWQWYYRRVRARVTGAAARLWARPHSRLAASAHPAG